MSDAILLLADRDKDHVSRLERDWPGTHSRLNLITAHSADDAFDVLDGTYCDVVVAGQRLRGGPGTELLRTVKTMCPATRVILAPRTLTTRLLMEASSIPVQTVLRKPFTAEDLARVVAL